MENNKEVPSRKPDLAETLLQWADQMETESPSLGRMLAIEVRTRITQWQSDNEA